MNPGYRGQGLLFNFRRVFNDEGSRPLLAAFAAIGLLLSAALWLATASRALSLSEREFAALSKAIAYSDAPSRRSSSKISPSLLSPPHLVEVLHSVAQLNVISIGDINFSMEGVAKLPYGRYRAVFSLSATYPAVRKFVANILAASNNIVLETMSCARSDQHEQTLECDLTFSELYAKP